MKLTGKKSTGKKSTGKEPSGGQTKGKGLVRVFTVWLAWLGMTMWLCACSLVETGQEKVRDLDFTVLGEEKIPDELLTVIGERKSEAFGLTYSDQEALYIVIGYGEKETGGYSITVDELYLGEDAIYVSTTLLGPESAQTVKAASYPYIVIKTEALDKTVIFE